GRPCRLRARGWGRRPDHPQSMGHLPEQADQQPAQQEGEQPGAGPEVRGEGGRERAARQEARDPEARPPRQPGPSSIRAMTCSWHGSEPYVTLCGNRTNPDPRPPRFAMSPTDPHRPPRAATSRRDFLQQAGGGLGLVALAWLLREDRALVAAEG